MEARRKMHKIMTRETLRAVRTCARATHVTRAPHSRCLLLGMAICLSPLVAISAQEKPSPPNFLTGKDLEQQLSLAAGISWSSNPLRDGLNNLSRSHKIAILLDRRIDPDQRIDVSTPPIPLWDLLQQIAVSVVYTDPQDTVQRADVGRVGPVVYIGPQETVRVLSTVIVLQQQQVDRLPSTLRQRLKRSHPFSWQELSTPQDLINRLAGEVSMSVIGLERIPHDLWPAVDLPPLDFVERMGLVLAGFGLTFEFTGDNSLQLVPLPASALIKRDYAAPGKPPQWLVQLRRQLPAANVSMSGGRLVVVGTVEDHDCVRRELAGSPVDGAGTRYSLRIVNQPLGPLATGLARRLGRTVQFHPDLADQLETRVSFNVEDSTLDELLTAMLTPVNMAYQMDDKTLKIIPGGPR